MRRLLGTLVVAAAIGGCGSSTPASIVPADAQVYVSVADGEPARRLIETLQLRTLEYDRDVRPWIGDRAAFFTAGEEQAALVLETRDEDAAEDWARRRAGVTQLGFWEMIEGRLVLASSRELRSRLRRIAEDGPALADSARFDGEKEAGDDAPAALLVGREKRAISGAARWFAGAPRVTQGALIQLLPDHEAEVTARLWLEDDQTRLDVSGLAPARGAPPSLEDLPGTAWLAIATPDLGADVLIAGSVGLTGTSLYTRAELSTGIDLEDTLGALGPATLLVQGGTQDDFSAQVQAAVRDEAIVRRAGILAGRALRRRESVEMFTGDGVQVSSSLTDSDPTGTGLIDSLSVHVENQRLVVRSGAPVGGTDENLGETARYRDAERRLGRPPALLADLVPLARLLRLPPPPEGTYVAGSETSAGGRRVNRFVLVRP